MTSNQFQQDKLYKKVNLANSALQHIPQQRGPYIPQNSTPFDKFALQPGVNESPIGVMDYTQQNGSKRPQPEPLTFNELDINMDGIRVPYNSPDSALPKAQNQQHSYGCCGFVFTSYDEYVNHASATHPQFIQMNPAAAYQHNTIINTQAQMAYVDQNFNNITVPTTQTRQEEIDTANPTQIEYSMEKLQYELDNLITGSALPGDQVYRSQSQEFFVNKSQYNYPTSQYSMAMSAPSTPLSESWQSSHGRLNSRKSSWIDNPNHHLSNQSLQNFNNSNFQNQIQATTHFEQQPQNTWVYERTQFLSNGINGQLYPLNFDKPYKCTGYPDCNKSYKNSNGLKYHLIHVHGDNPGGSTPELDLDGSQPNSPASFVHPQFRRYQCPFKGCDKKYKNLSGLRYHFTHTHSHLSEDEIKNLLREVKERGDAGEGAVFPQHTISNQNSIEDLKDLI
ncbi:Transcriptional regulator of ribosomal biogenesis proteins [Boothiomyces sp. JEL0838]|nr:Transcriptional regulator of ribosomal biogenesis proteins [Boothiomyces sp. JEL0838]